MTNFSDGVRKKALHVAATIAKKVYLAQINGDGPLIVLDYSILFNAQIHYGKNTKALILNKFVDSDKIAVFFISSTLCCYLVIHRI